MKNRFPFITAHTGCEGTPDNSRWSVESGLSCGADIIEEDILVTADGIAVLSHDDEVVAADGTKISISKQSYDHLKRIQIQTGHVQIPLMPILCLADVLPVIKSSGKRLNLDMKSDESIAPSFRLITEFGIGDQVFLSGCESDRAAMAQRDFPKLKKLLNADESLFQRLDFRDAAIKTCEDAVSSACIGINLHYGLLRKPLIDEAARYQLPLYVWTVNERENMLLCIRQGAYSITTRSVTELSQLKQSTELLL